MSCSKASDGCAIRCYQLSYFSPTKIEKLPGILSLRGNNDLVRWSFFDEQIILYFTVRNDSLVSSRQSGIYYHRMIEDNQSFSD